MATGALAISGPPGPRAAAAHYACRPGLNCDIARTCRDADRHASQDRIVTSTRQRTSDRAPCIVTHHYIFVRSKGSTLD